MQEEVENKTVNLAVKTGKVTSETLYRALRAYLQNKTKDKPKKGKQSVRQLMKRGDTVKTVDIDDSSVREFEKTAKKYGLDFAIVKDKESDPPKYTVFFKAKDDDVITRVMKDHTAEKFMGKKRAETEKKPSVLKKLKSFKDVIASKPKKEKVKRKEHER